jgi:tetratricopeptide (TPR) repeat protein
MPEACPDSRDLERLAQGKLPKAEAEPLGRHILACSACAQLLGKLQAADPLVSDLRAAAGAQTPENTFLESLVERLVRTSPDRVAAAGSAPATAPLRRETERAPLPDRVRGYEVLEELGRGGMGVVYKARHLLLNRLVALKMVRAGALAGSAELARFRQEAEAVARMQHPGIVQIYEVGEEDGTPFLALEFVSGGNLAQKLAGKPQPPDQAAHLVETLARAVHSAHQCGIVHRDLKPANILLQMQNAECRKQNEKTARDSAFCNLHSAFCIPKIADFGLAKRLEGGPGRTQTGDILGTPGYMAPEQAAGQAKAIGPAADVYGLGAILYEMLTGRPPFQGETPWDTVVQVMSQEPVSPARLQPKVPRELETICLKCLHKEPGKRYASALALAEDLRRFLVGEPIMARPTGAWERTLKWAKRRPAAAALLVFSGVALVALVVAGIAYNRWLQDEVVREQERTQEAERQRAEIASQRARAEANFRAARDAVDRMLTRVGGKPLANIPHAEQVRRQLLEDALQFYLRFLRQRGADPQVQRETARAYRRVGDIHMLLGRPRQAGEDYRRAVTLQKQLSADFPAVPAYRQDLVETYANRGYFLAETNHPREAESAFRQALALAQRLSADFPREPFYQKELAARHFNLGSLLSDQGQYAAAEPCYTQAIQLQTRLVTDFPKEGAYRVALARSYNNLGLLQRLTGRPQEAHRTLLRSIDLRRTLRDRLAGEAEFRFELANTHNSLGVILLYDLDKPQPAEAEFRKACTLQRTLARDFPSVPDYRHQLAGTLHNMAELLLERNELPEARQALEEAIRLQHDALHANPNNPTYRKFLRNHAAALVETLLKLKDAVPAAAAAQVPLPFAGGWEEYWDAARGVAQCIPVLAQDTRLTDERRRELAQRFAGRAVQLIRDAVGKGWKDVEALRKEPALAPLRSRDDFKGLVAELTKPQKAARER